MFRGGQANPYDDIVAKTTDENLTSENWELILNLCDKVQDEGEQGARNVIAALLKRLAHRNPNVQLYTLSLAESLTKNCGIQLHREIASRAFTQGLERIIQDRNAHDKVKRRALELIAMWTAEFEKDPTLGIMEECYNNLKSKGFKFEAPPEAPPPDVDDEVRRREEEELQRVLEMSMHDKGGRGQWSEYSLAAKNSGASGPSSSTPKSQPQPQQPIYGGYVPAANPTVSADNHTPSPATTQTPSTVSYTAPSPAPSNKSSTHTNDSLPLVTRVRALHTFEPTEAGELGFDKGDIIKVVDRGYKDWWRGQLKGRTGIFPVNYVEPLPEPTAAELAKEAEQEAAVFGQAANVDRLLTALRQMDPAKDNLADNEEIQELYRSCMSLRPKIVKLIDKYTQKRADLVSMNESFVKARTIFDRMMEESLARHTGIYDGRPPYGAPVQPYQGRPDSRARQDYAPPPQSFGWNPSLYDQPGYNAYPAPQAAYGGPPPPGPESSYPGAPQPYGVPEPYPPPQHAQPVYGQSPYGAPPASQPQPQQQPGVAPAPYHTPGPHEPQGYPGIQVPPQAQQPLPQAVSPPVATPQPFGGYGGVPGQPQPDVQAQHVPPQPQHQASLPMQPQPQAQPQIQPQQEPIQTQPLQPVVTQAQPQAQPQVQPQAQSQPQTASPVQQHQQQQQDGPPFVYDPNGTYEDANVQAWAQYYAHGGTDPTGSVYFISVPGVKEAPKPTPSRSASQDTTSTVQPQAAQPAQGYSDPTVAGSVAPLNVQPHDPSQPAATAPAQQPSSPSQQHTFYQPQPTGAPASPSQQHQQAPYGAFPYGSSPYPAQPGVPAPGGAPPAGGDQQAWQGQYYNMPSQFANMSVGDGHQGAQPGPGPQVGTPA